MQQSELLKGVLDLAVLAAVGRGESYGYEVLQRLAEAGLEGVGDASVYGALKRLDSQGYLRSRLEASPQGPARRYYTQTPAGVTYFRKSGVVWEQFSRAIDAVLKEGRRTS
jgi:PadR family transcriptional regulator, regulatory protein PadR